MNRLNFIDLTSYWLDRLSRLLLVIVMALMIADVLFGVINRFIFKFSLSGIEEIARILMIWACMLGAGIAFRSGGHIAVIFVYQRLKNFKLPVLLFNNVIIGIFIFILTYYGIITCISKASLYSPAMRLSMFWPFLAIPTGSTVMMIHILYLTKQIIANREYL